MMTQTSIEIGKAALVGDVSLLRKPVNVDELNALIDELLVRPRRFRLVHPRSTGAKLGDDEPNPEFVSRYRDSYLQPVSGSHISPNRGELTTGI